MISDHEEAGKAHQPIREKKNQPTWIDKGLVDLRSCINGVGVLKEPLHIDAGTDEEAALTILMTFFGLTEQNTSITIDTPIGAVLIDQTKLTHIVEKRVDARERYVNFALETMKSPFEIWAVEYDNDSIRLAYIGVFEGKRQMLVVVSTVNGKVLWNFMHCDRKTLNKHRHGELRYVAQ